MSHFSNEPLCHLMTRAALKTLVTPPSCPVRRGHTLLVTTSVDLSSRLTRVCMCTCACAQLRMFVSLEPSPSQIRQQFSLSLSLSPARSHSPSPSLSVSKKWENLPDCPQTQWWHKSKKAQLVPSTGKGSDTR